MIPSSPVALRSHPLFWLLSIALEDAVTVKKRKNRKRKELLLTVYDVIK